MSDETNNQATPDVTTDATVAPVEVEETTTTAPVEAEATPTEEAAV